MEKICFNNEIATEAEYFNLISGKEEHGNFKKPIDLLKNARKKYDCCDFEYQFLTLIIRNFRKVILMKPKSMQYWSKMIDRHYKNKFYQKEYDQVEEKWKYSQTSFGKELSSSLAYSKLQKKVLKKFFYRNKIQTCCYCNAQYTLSFKNEDVVSVKFQIDHIFPKKKYPFFSISLYNLIPSCANCNLNKGDKDFWIQNYCHPYLESLGDRFKFTLSKESDRIIYTKSSEVDLDNLQIGMTNLSDKKVKAHNSMFDIEGIHGNFKNIAQEILSLGKEYPEAKRYELLEKYKNSKGVHLFSSKESIDRVFLRIYPEKIKRNERPLSKFIQDIARFSDFYDD